MPLAMPPPVMGEDGPLTSTHVRLLRGAADTADDTKAAALKAVFGVAALVIEAAQARQVSSSILS